MEFHCHFIARQYCIKARNRNKFPLAAIYILSRLSYLIYPLDFSIPFKYKTVKLIR